MNVEEHGLKPGAPANLVVLDQADLLDAVRFHARPSYVVSHGRIVDQQQMQQLAKMRLSHA
jgi:cytosine deaminase